MLVAINPPPGFVADDAVFAAPGRFKAGNAVRFYDDLLQTIGGWESVTTTLLTGVCRTVCQWTDNASTQTIAAGTHSALQVWKAGTPSTVTPTLSMPLATLGPSPLTTINLSATVAVVHNGHGLTTGDSVIIAGAVAVGGITAPNLNGTRTVTVTGTNGYTFTAGAAASSGATGGGSAVTISPQNAFTAGKIDGAADLGYGTGTYGTGTYGTHSTGVYYPRTWALSAYETGDLYANPRGGTIYRWQQDGAVIAKPLDNAPRQATFMLCNPQRQVMAFGCSESVSGIFDPLCIRWSDIEGPTTWAESSANNAGEYVLGEGGRIVAARVVGNYVFVWTDVNLYLGTFIGSPDDWQFQKVGDHCGLIGPNAVALVGQTALWISPDAQFWSCPLGGAPSTLGCAVQQEFADNIAVSQQDKIVASTVSKFGEVWWFYPDARDGVENSRHVTFSPTQGWWTGQLARTAYCDAGPSVDPIGVTYGGALYWQERGSSADGAALSGYIETTDFYLDEGQEYLKINGHWPNFKDQVGPVNLTIYAREYPQSTERTKGPYLLTPGLAKKSLRVTARIVRLRWDFGSAPAYVRAGKQEFEVETLGAR